MEFAVKNIKYSTNNEYFLLTVKYEKGTTAIKPGQFFRIKTPAGPYIARPYSVYDYKDGTLKFLIKSGGEFENFLKCSSTVFLDGPLGNAILKLENPLLIAGGVGYAPLHFYATQNECEIVIGARKEEFFDLVEILPSTVCTIEPSTVLDVAKFSPLQNVIACGPIGMLKAVKDTFNDRNVHLVLEEKMACGRGMCEGCAVMTNKGVKFVCKDGPSFSAKEVNLNWTR